jgi:hypothetical protein
MSESIRRAKSTTRQAVKKAVRPGPRADRADGQRAALAKIAAMPEPDRAMGERLHAMKSQNSVFLVPLKIARFRAGWALIATGWLLSAVHATCGEAGPPTYEAYLRRSVVEKKTLDVFLDRTQLSWAKFDPVTGYRLGNYMPRDGIDRSSTLSTVASNGMRTAHAYVDRPCRINTYGDSFTLCHQVSDSETWQEYLAGHLGEPIRNFGMGGYGVYQAYRRMLSEERTEHSAEYLIFYIWGDDHVRSLLRCRHAAIYRWWTDEGGRMFHNNFWANVEMNLQTGQLEEHENLLPTPESVYKMTDPDWTVQALKDDLALNLFMYSQGAVSDLEMKSVRRLAAFLKFPQQGLEGEQPSRDLIDRLLNSYGFAATKMILAKAKAFADGSGKQLLVILFDPSRVMRPLAVGKPRYDQVIVDFLTEQRLRFFDMNVVHVQDFKSLNIPFDQYLKRYFIGHYNPAGNHFFAYAIKNTVVDWLNPKPITYQKETEREITFENYLPK